MTGDGIGKEQIMLGAEPDILLQALDVSEATDRQRLAAYGVTISQACVLLTGAGSRSDLRDSRRGSTLIVSLPKMIGRAIIECSW